MSEAVDGLKLRLRADLKTAMQARDTLEISVLRSLMAAIDNGQAVPVDLSGPASAMRSFGDGAGEVARGDLSAGDLRDLLEREAVMRDEAAGEMEGLGLAAEVVRFKAEAAIVRRYLA